MATSDYTSKVIEIPLTKGYVTIVDEVDADLAYSHPKWNVRVKRNTAYVSRMIKPFIKRIGTTQYLHILILEKMLNRSLVKGEKVDHINGNGLDCRRCNLRLATHQQNIRNSKLNSANKSGFKGAMFIRGKWVAKITINAKTIFLGSFASAIDAGIAYNQAAFKYFGEFAYLNDIENWKSIEPKRHIDKRTLKKNHD